ncbi:MAG: hypothetical protein FJZ47_04970 [Candidatus Tectomicrobia bacterium]|uniref:Apolipoprotein N-acyltransferase n=1 Tax=Tectimicrobiota bacterium TaxID=2528274 RepID=A0A937VY99_UNCTE|nr:hypothetical protein [Candidatus Tectomicrobia bacterium]
MAPQFWPWLGLGLVSSALVAWGMLWPAASWARATTFSWYLGVTSLYLFLLLRHSAWRGWPWLAVGTLMGAGLTGTTAALWTDTVGWSLRLPFFGLPLPWGWVWGVFAWINMLVLGVRVWRRSGEAVAVWLGWRTRHLMAPLLGWPAIALSL